MKKVIALVMLMSLAACGKGHVDTLPPPPKNTEVVQQNIPVPVLCKAQIKRAQSAIDQAEQGLKMEQQNAILRKTIAEQRAYIALLEAGIVGCGGAIE